MARKKRTSKVLERAELRMAGLKAIDPQLDLGEARSLEGLSDLVESLRTRLDAYNTALTVVDSSQAEIDELEKSLADLTETMLLGVAFKYGKDSQEYEMAGGTRKSDRIKRSSYTRIKSSSEAGTVAIV